MRIKPEFLKLATALRAAPMYFADIFGVSPERLEQLLQKRGQTSEDESLYASVQRHYGNRVAEELWRLVGICPFIPEKDPTPHSSCCRPLAVINPNRQTNPKKL